MHNVQVSGSSSPITSPTTRSVICLQVLTIVWMIVEAVVSLRAAWIARSPALFGFGGDSAVELLSAVVVLRRFQVPCRGAHVEERAAKVAGGLLFALAAFVVFASVYALLGHIEPRPNAVGMVVLVVAAIGMALLAQQKRRLSAVTRSASLRADAAESKVCGYLAWIALAGLLVNAIWGIRWADPIAAVGLLPLILREGWEVMHGKPCCD
jgi:Co/Zn/Cd efflux system component